MAAEASEKSLEEILKNGPKPGIPESPESSPFAGNPEPVIGCPLLRIVQDLIGLRRLLELLFRRLIAGILVRVILMGQPTVGSFDLFGSGFPIHPQHLVVIALTHDLHVPGFGFILIDTRHSKLRTRSSRLRDLHHRRTQDRKSTRLNY